MDHMSIISNEGRTKEEDLDTVRPLLSPTSSFPLNSKYTSVISASAASRLCPPPYIWLYASSCAIVHTSLVHLHLGIFLALSTIGLAPLGITEFQSTLPSCLELC